MKLKSLKNKIFIILWKMDPNIAQGTKSGKLRRTQPYITETIKARLLNNSTPIKTINYKTT